MAPQDLLGGRRPLLSVLKPALLSGVPLPSLKCDRTVL